MLLFKKRLKEVVQKNFKQLKKIFNIISKKNFENTEFNIISYLNENEKKNFLVKKIRLCWKTKTKKFVNIHTVIFDYVVLMFAFKKFVNLKNKKYSNIQKKIKELYQILRNGSWKPKIYRRVLITKKLENSKSSIILPFYDEVITTAIKIILNFIFEKEKGLNLLLQNVRYFHNANHAFRPQRNFHTALNTILTWRLLPWIIQSNIVKCYNNINQKRLVSIIKKSIKDQLLIGTPFYTNIEL
jgi:hypothetical protein